ncbi:MAG: hypothetical protein F4Y61_06245 [Rhodothermaceae bacterium]|nr:hypothetical protein [Rhodothermaceae bacterium]MYF78727.1 hypothetical protein [Chloroflexota bacterium]
MNRKRRLPGYLLGSVSVVILVMGLAAVAVNQNIAWRWEQHRRYVDTQTEAQLAFSAKAILTEAVRWEADPTATPDPLIHHKSWHNLNGELCTSGYVGDCWRLQKDEDGVTVTELAGRLDLKPKALTMTAELGVGCVFPTDTAEAEQCDLRGNTEVRLMRAVIAPFQLHLADLRFPTAARAFATRTLSNTDASVFTADTTLAHLSLAEPADPTNSGTVYYCDPFPAGLPPGFRVEGSVEAHHLWKWENVCDRNPTGPVTLAPGDTPPVGNTDSQVVVIGSVQLGALADQVTRNERQLEQAACNAPPPCYIDLGLGLSNPNRAVYHPSGSIQISGVTDESFVLVARDDIVVDVSAGDFGIDAALTLDPEPSIEPDPSTTIDEDHGHPHEPETPETVDGDAASGTTIPPVVPNVTILPTVPPPVIETAAPLPTEPPTTEAPTTAPPTTVKITETTVPVTVPSTNERVTVPIREGVTIHDDGRATVADPNLDGDNNPATGDDNCYTQNNGYRVCNVYHYGNDPQLPARANQFERIANPGDFILSGPNSDGHAASLPIDLQIGSWRTVPQSPGYDFEGWQIVVEIRPLTTLGSNVYDIRLCDVSPWWGNNGHYVGTANGMTWGVYAVQDDDGRYRLAMKGARFGEPC